MRQSVRRALVLGGRIFVLCSLIICCGALAQAEKVPFKITEKEARRLAAEAYGHPMSTGPFEFGPKIDAPFFVFDTYSVPPAQSFDWFAVNPWTGDVFSLWDCRKLSTPALRKSQAAIRRRFTPDELKQYERLSQLKPKWPDCTFEN